MAGAYCMFCSQRCFVYRDLPDGSWGGHMATCARGMQLDREATGHDHTTAINPHDPVPADEQPRQAGRLRPGDRVAETMFHGGAVLTVERVDWHVRPMRHLREAGWPQKVDVVFVGDHPTIQCPADQLWELAPADAVEPPTVLEERDAALAEVERLAEVLHARELHPDFDYTNTIGTEPFAPKTAGWELNPHVRGHGALGTGWYPTWCWRRLKAAGTGE